MLISRANVTELFLHTIGVSESRDSLEVLLPAVSHDIGCEIARDPVTGNTTLPQKHYAEEILRSHGFWGIGDIPLRNTHMKPNARLSKDDRDPNPKPDFHHRYRGIVGNVDLPQFVFVSL